MTYTPTVWKDETGVGDGTIITAARLNNIESGIGSAQGIVGPAGPTGPKGDTGYETAPIGTVLAWSGKAMPQGFVLADGARYPQGPYPQGYAFAGQEVAAGNPLWTQRVSDTTFTVPDLRDRFLLSAGATYPFGTPAGGEAAHRLTLAESPSHSHYVQTMINAVASNQAGDNNDAPLNARGGSYRQVGFKAAMSEGSDQLHNNMPPYVVIAQIVKVAGVTISAGAITGPPGAAGAAGGQSYIQDIGDGAARAFTVTHGFGTRAVQVSVYTSATPYSEVIAEIEHVDANTVMVRTSAGQPAPTAGQYTVAVAAPGTTLTSSTLMDTWHTVGPQGGPEPAFQNSWSNYNPPSDQVLQFRKDPFGRVLLRGIVKNGTVGQPIFNLPVGYRPPAPVRITVLASGTLGYMVIDSVTGYVLLSTGSNAWVTLDTVEFDTDSVSEYGRGPKGDAGPVGPAGAGQSAYEGAVQSGVIDNGFAVIKVTNSVIQPGVAYVRATDGTLVRVSQSSSTTVLPPATAVAGTFRLDEYVIDTLGAISRLPGTVESSAVTLDNRTGFAPIPAGMQLLHDVRVGDDGPQFATSRDRRPWARGAFSRILRTSNAAGGIDYTTSSTASTWIDAVNLALRMECSGKPLRVKLLGSAQHNTAGAATAFQLLVDNVSPDGASDGFYGHTAAVNYVLPFAHEWVFVPTAGSRLIQPAWKVSSGQGLILCRATFPVTFYVEEITRDSFRNGTA